MRQLALKSEMPQLELKSLGMFLAIRHCQQTKIGEVINQAQSLLKNVYVPIGVKLLKQRHDAIGSPQNTQ